VRNCSRSASAAFCVSRVAGLIAQCEERATLVDLIEVVLPAEYVTMRPSGRTSESMLRLMYAEYFGSRVDAPTRSIASSISPAV
jgi:hypothetical protein